MSKAFNFTLSLTHNCQLRCSYCYAGDKIKKVMDRKTIDRAIEMLFKQPMEKLEFGFFGGEPLLQWDDLVYATEIVQKRAKEQKLPINQTITTNGLCFTPERITWLKKHLFYMVISLDGNQMMHDTHRIYPNGRGSFDDVVKGLKMLQEQYQPDEYSINLVVTPKNLPHLAASIRELVEQYGVKDISIAPDLYDEWDDVAELWEEQYEAVGERYLEWYRSGNPVKISFIDDKITTGIEGGYDRCNMCSFGRNELIVAPSGNLFPCERLIGDDSDQNVIIGNVFDGFDYKKKQGLLALRGNSNPECETCTLQPRCMNFCGCTNYTMTQSINLTSGTLCFQEKLCIKIADSISEQLYKERNPHFMSYFYHDDSYFK